MTTVVRHRELDSGDYSDGSPPEIDQDTSGNGGVQNDESDYDSAASDSLHSDRDPDNQETERRVDDDEDRSNPQYIPKRGTFYEHDDRTAASGGEESINTVSETASEKKEPDTPADRRRGRKSESQNKWSHDKYNENEQMPKSRDELVAIYGYDIRNEDAPPHARRNRRYGRGPNKYTRTWEDEEAYKRQAAAPPAPRKPPNLEDFPELDAVKHTKKRAPRPRSKSQPSSTESLENGSLRRNASIKARQPAPRAPRTAHREDKLPPVENLTITANFNNTAPYEQLEHSSSAESLTKGSLGRNRRSKPARPQLKEGKRTTADHISNTANFNNSAPYEQLDRSSTEPIMKGSLRRNRDARGTPAGPLHKEDKLPVETLTITANFNNSESQPQRKINATVAQQRPVPTEQGKKKPPPQDVRATQQQPQQPTATPNKSPPQQQQPQQPQQKSQQQQQPAHEPRGSKRYSSLRQRPLDTYSTPQQTAAHHRYHEYPAGSQPATQHQGSPAPQQLPHPQQLMQQMVRNQTVSQQQHGPSPPHQPLPQQQLQQQQIQQQQIQQQLPQQQIPQQQLPQQQLPQQQIQAQQLPQPQIQPQQLQQQQISQQHNQQQVRLGILEQPQMVTHPHHTIHNLPQHTMGQLQPAQAYAPPAMMPAQYMQQSSSGAVFGAAPIYAQPPAPYPHQIYPLPHNYATQAGGVTYYSCAEQDALPRATRRPTAAIPIVRPAQPDRPANSSEKDNIDRIVENMFVRKPWPPTSGTDSKEKSESRNSQEPQSKESSQPNSLTSSSISTDSKPSESIDKEETPVDKEAPKLEKDKETPQEQEERESTSISTDA